MPQPFCHLPIGNPPEGGRCRIMPRLLVVPVPGSGPSVTWSGLLAIRSGFIKGGLPSFLAWRRAKGRCGSLPAAVIAGLLGG